MDESQLTEAQTRAIARDDAISAHMGVDSYDPDRVLSVRYADVIGARNAIGHLLTILKRGTGHPPETEFMQHTVRSGVAAGVFNDRPHEFATIDDATDWLGKVRLRLTQTLPAPTSTKHRPGDTTAAALTAALTAAADALRSGGDLDKTSVPDLAELGGALDDLLTRLTTWTHRVAPQVADLPTRHELREDTGAEPTARCHQAADHLTHASGYLHSAQAAAQDFHAALAHLAGIEKD